MAISPLPALLRQPRLRGEAYMAFLDEVMGALAQWAPGAVVQFEDFANHTAFALLERYRERYAMFNDDIQVRGLRPTGLVTRSCRLAAWCLCCM